MKAMSSLFAKKTFYRHNMNVMNDRKEIDLFIMHKIQCVPGFGKWYLSYKLKITLETCAGLAA